MASRTPRRYLPEVVSTETKLETRELLTTLPEGIVIRDWTSGLYGPTTFVSDHESQIFVGNLDGTIQLVSTLDGQTQYIGRVDAENVDARGLYGLTLDPEFHDNHTMYVFYYALNGTGGREARVSKLVLEVHDEPMADGHIYHDFSETILMRINIPNSPGMHHGGALEVDNKGHLFFAIGDLEEPRKVARLDNPNGKVFRINTDGTIPKDNPYYRRSRGLGRAVWATGLREPMKSSYDPATDTLLIHDVGFFQQEEINEIKRGKNYGWPNFEGTYKGSIRGGNGARTQFPLYAYKNMASLNQAMLPTNFTKRYQSPIATNDTIGCAILGGTYFHPTKVLDSALANYVGDYLFVDLCSGWVDAIDFNSRSVNRLASDVQAQLLDVEYTNDGRIFLLTRADVEADNKIILIETEQQKPPAFSNTRSSQVVPEGESVTFYGDPSGPGPISYQWFHDGTPIEGATGSSLTLDSTSVAESPGVYTLEATNPFGSSMSQPWNLDVVSRPRPTIDLTVSKDGQPVKYGDTINFSAIASDVVDGQLDPSQFIWKVELRHNAHGHPLLDLNSTTSGSFEVGNYVYEIGELSIRLTLTVTNSAGLTQAVVKSWPVHF